MSGVVSRFEIEVQQAGGYEFRVRFDKEQFAELRMDEPPPLGHDVAPNAARVLAAAIGNCLAASLVFCAKKHGITLDGVNAKVAVELARNEQRRLRIGKVHVRIEAPNVNDDALEGCLATFEEFCVVTQSVRQGIDVEVEVADTASGVTVRA